MSDDGIIPDDDTFAAWVRSAEDGQLVHELGGEVRQSIVHLRKHAEKTNKRAKGVLTLKIKLEVDPKGIMETEAEIAAKLPKLTRARSVHWTDEDGDILNRRPEKQLELRGVTGNGGAAAPAAPTKDPAAPAVKAM
jgi:hypothetical protein